jgi:dTDP-4-dehydrorhamnose reductase
MMRIAVTGRNGQVALALAERAALKGIEIVRLGRPELDLARPETVAPALAAARADIIVSAAAHTGVDRAESEPELAMAVNGEAPGAIGAAAAALGVPVIHLSTDYVFAGDKAAPYVETDPVGPRTVYGLSKLRGEQALMAATPRHVILRTAWVYSPFGSNFVRTMLRLAGQQGAVRVVADQRGCPTSALDIGQAVLAIAARLAAERHRPELYGLFHMVGQGEASWADFAAAIFETSARLGGPSATIVPVATADYPTPARRPANSRLDTAKLRAVYSFALPDWRVSLVATLRRLVGEIIEGRQR